MAAKAAKKRVLKRRGAKASKERAKAASKTGMAPLLPLGVGLAVLALLLGGYWLVHPRGAVPPAAGAPPADGSIVINNVHQGTCSVDEQGRPCLAKVSLDGAAPQSVADESKFVFSGLAQGSHSIAVTSDCSILYAKGGEWNCIISLAPGSTYTLLLSCGANGALSPSCPASP